MAAKMLGGLAIGGGLGLLAGVILSFIEAAEAEGEQYDVVIPAPTLTPATTDAVNVDGKVVHPKGMRPPEVDAGRAEEWRSEDNLVIDGRRYDSTVDRATQILWPGEPQPDPVLPGESNPNHKGYTGRWGPRVESDVEARRAGMHFPNFWLIFFDQLVRKDQPARSEKLTRESGTSWTVPADWNSTDNSIACIGGGGGAVNSGVETVRAGGSGGGGAFAKISNLALTAGATVAFAVGAGGANAAPGAKAGDGGETFFKDASTVSAKGGIGANATTGGAGGAGGIGELTFPGGSGAKGGVGQVGGSGGGGAGGPSGAGANGAAAAASQRGGAGGGGNGGGAAGAGTQTGLAGNAGGDQQGRGRRGRGGRGTRGRRRRH
jgi:hypothetical protein